MGEVYKARDTRLDRIVAVKILPPALAADAVFRERFDREARAISSLDHPHICALHDVGEQAGLAYIVMQFVEGDTLADRLRRGAVSYAEASAIAVQIASALEAAHERGIVHRDLKPGNVIVSRDGVATVLDFGLAKDVTAPGATALSMSPTMIGGPTQPGVILGTAAYMAPEQARGLAVDKRADIWAFGCVLYEMLAGRPAFRGDTVTDIVAAVVTHEPDWSALPAATPIRTRELLQRCLSKDSKRRLRDIGDARLELEEKPAQPAVQDVVPYAPSRPRVGWRLAVALASASAAIGAGAALGLYGGPAAERAVTRLEIATPPSVDPGSFAISPDGRTLVYVATTDAGTGLWLRPLDQAAAQPLAGTEGATQPFWAPDGRAIGFFADGKLKRVERAGGTPQVLADTPFPRGGSWSRDGVILFSPNSPGGLARVPAEGGAVTLVTTATGESHRWPQLLDDGRRFLFYRTLNAVERRGVYLGTLNGGEPVRIIAGEAAAAFAPPDRLLVVREGALDVFRLDVARAAVIGNPITVATGVGIDTNTVRGVVSVSRTGVLAHRGSITVHRQLTWMDRAGHTLGVLGPSDEFAPAAPTLAPDGRRAAVQRFARGNVDIWIVESVRGLSSRFTFEPMPDLSPVWSPEGRRIVFESTRDNVSTLLVKNVNGADDPQPLIATPDRKLPKDWSSDGRFV